jgi:hypothetical protein
MAILPAIFKSLLWSYDFDRCDPMAIKKTVIKQALNYGTMEHWRWINSFYGDEQIRDVLSHIQATEINPKTRKLAEIIFNFNSWNYAPRGVK